MGGFLGEVHPKITRLYEVPTLRNTPTTTAASTTTTTTTITIIITTTTTTTTTTLGHWGVPGGSTRENPRSLSSPKVEKFDFEKNSNFWIGQ